MEAELDAAGEDVRARPTNARTAPTSMLLMLVWSHVTVVRPYLGVDQGSSRPL